MVPKTTAVESPGIIALGSGSYWVNISRPESIVESARANRPSRGFHLHTLKSIICIPPDPPFSSELIPNLVPLGR